MIVAANTVQKAMLAGDVTPTVTGSFMAGNAVISLVNDPDVTFDPTLDNQQFNGSSPTFSGYGTVTTAWSGPALAVDGGWMLYHNAVFTQSGGSNTDTVYGWWANVADGNGGQWIGEKFAEPVPMAVGSILQLLCKFEPGPVQGTSPPEQ